MCNFVLDLGLSDSLKIPQFNGLDKRRICIQKNKGRRHWSFAPYYDLFSRIAISWIVVEMALSLSCYHAGQWACVFSLPYKTHKARNGHKRKSGGGGIGYFTFLLTHSHFLYLALPLLHLAIQLTKSWPRMGGQTS
jgi:hypothetical protein